MTREPEMEPETGPETRGGTERGIEPEIEREVDPGMARDLRAALAAADPGAAFTGGVLAAVARQRASDGPSGSSAPSWDADAETSRSRWRWLLPVAAAVVLAVTGAEWVREHRELQRARAVQAQVLQALRVTSQKLNVVHGVVERQRD